jgi:hypothetical protein
MKPRRLHKLTIFSISRFSFASAIKLQRLSVTLTKSVNDLNKVTGSKLLTEVDGCLAFGDEVGADQGAGGADGSVPLHFADGGWGEVVE